MRIVVSGTHASGKSTLISDFALRHPEFTVLPDGQVQDVKLREASRPEFGHSLRAAVELWKFQPTASGRVEPVVLVQRIEFKPPEAPGDPLARLTERVSRGDAMGGVGLDEKLAPRYQLPAKYPEALLGRGRPSGRARVEFIVDRDGRCRMPKIISATEEEFGWAAATAVSQWYFKPPTRDGRPTEVRVQIPFLFNPSD